MSRGHEQTLFPTRHTKADRYMKRCSTSLVYGKCKSKLQWDIPSHVRMVSIHKTSSKCWRGCEEKGTLIHSVLMGMWMVQLLWKAIWRFLKKLRIELPCNPEIPLVGIYLKKLTTFIKIYVPRCSLQHIHGCQDIKTT